MKAKQNKEKKPEEKVNDPKQKKPKNKFKIIGLSILFILVIVGSYIGYTEYYLPETREYIVKVYGENNSLYDELTFKRDSYIRLLDNEEKEVDIIKLDKDTEKLILEDNEDQENLIFKEWEFEEKLDEKDEFYKRNIIYFNAKPIYEDKEDFILTFKASDDKAVVLNEADEEVSYLKKGYKKDNNIVDYFPEVSLEEDFKGDWYIGNNIIDKDTEITNDSEIEFKTYQDKNNNNIDDFTERFDIDFVTNVNQEVDSINVGWEETINLPKLKDETKVFYEWYQDKEFEEEFTETTKVTNDLTLYAKVKTFEDIVNGSVNDPIDREDISLQIEEMIEERNKPVDEAFKNEIEEKEREREEIRRYNEENNIVTQDIEFEINLHNKNHNKLHLITFLDPSNEFIYSLVAPYGQTIKVVNENGDLYKEYGVRQNSTIILDEDILLSKSSELAEYHSEYRKINNAVFIKIQPIVN